MRAQPEALRLAELMDYLSNDSYEWWQEFDKCAAELRRLYAEVDRLSYQLAYPDNFVKEPEQEPVAIADGTFNHNCPVGTLLYTSPPSLSLAQRKPLTDEEIENIQFATTGDNHIDRARNFARAIEAAHGIKGDA